ncbi:NAD(P)-binding protein [Pholiota conissans]|uniref:D-xylose 1-dehydrogenase (NADP(+), D-xylono-1,5-lactone-forming) n=1 Tax=Pholiota conissans TaxID=109636 RepID=A0A9P6CX36_9AGAR|nr:NAD(P)-binding protein [Pholiota conissans]
MASAIGLVKRFYNILHPPTISKLSATDTIKPLKFGILGAANIAPIALIIPARSHPEVIIHAIAARNLAKAQKFAKRYSIPHAYEGYQALLDDPEVDVVYNPLPNALHHEWTMKALMAGKHVLNEKPSADTAEETRAMFELAEKKGLVLLDAYHYRFHPALKRAKAILESGELGAIKNMTVNMIIPGGIIPANDIRFDYELGGGALMDLGCYAVSCVRYMTSSEPSEVVATSHVAFEPKNPPTNYVRNVDRRMEATLGLPKDVTATIVLDLGEPAKYGFIPSFPNFGFTVDCELGSLTMVNHVVPTLYHSLTVKIKGGHTRVEKVYKGNKKGEEWWLTYRHQLEALVDKIRNREPETWLTKEDSVQTMDWIEKIYAKAGLGSRPKSTCVIP